MRQGIKPAPPPPSTNNSHISSIIFLSVCGSYRAFVHILYYSLSKYGKYTVSLLKQY